MCVLEPVFGKSGTFTVEVLTSHLLWSQSLTPPCPHFTLPGWMGQVSSISNPNPTGYRPPGPLYPLPPPPHDPLALPALWRLQPWLSTFLLLEHSALCSGVREIRQYPTQETTRITAHEITEHRFHVLE